MPPNTMDEKTRARRQRGTALLRGVVMRADRSRLASAIVAPAALHAAGAVVLRLPAADVAAGLCGLLLLIVAHRAVWIRLVPPLALASAEPPPLFGASTLSAPRSLAAACCLAAASLAVVTLASTSLAAATVAAALAASSVTAAVVAFGRPTGATSLTVITFPQWLVRGVGALVVSAATLLASLGHHGVLRARCSEGVTCAPPGAAVVAAWAALSGLAVGLEHALGGAELPSSYDAWPLAMQSPMARLRPAVPAALQRGACVCVPAAAALLVMTWLVPAAVCRLGALAITLGGGCLPCMPHDAGSAATAVELLGWLGLMARGAVFYASCRLSFASVHVSYTQPLNFCQASDSRFGDEVALEAALAEAAPPLTLHLGFLDAATLAQHEPHRRQALYAMERGASWPRLLGALLRPIDAMAVALEAERKRRGQPAKTANASLPLLPRRLAARLLAVRASMRDQAARASLLASSQVVVWAAEAVSCLIAASTNEDALGVVQLNDSLGVALSSLMRCLQALEAYVAGGAPLGGARARPSAHASQQSIALRVGLGPPAQLRAVGAQRATAVEAALSRAAYLLVHTYGRRAVLAAHVPPEQRPKLEAFLR